MELLLGRGADVNVQSGIFGNPLQAAASYPPAKEIAELDWNRLRPS